MISATDRETTRKIEAVPRVRPWLAAKAFARVMRDPEDTESGANFVLALEGRNAERLFERFRSDPKGARILSQNRDLPAALEDREALRAMPADSLGRAYLDFVETENISSEGLASVTRAPSDRFLAITTPERRIMNDRITYLHDVWHVATGYSRDLVGEACLIAFSYVQLGTRAYRLLIPLSYIGMGFRVPGMRALLRDAYRRSKRAEWLLVADWEALLGQPLTRVREELGIGPPPSYTRYFQVGSKLVAESS
jgi:ubiquinone biosynthesis protein COQ4